MVVVDGGLGLSEFGLGGGQRCWWWWVEQTRLIFGFACSNAWGGIGATEEVGLC